MAGLLRMWWKGTKTRKDKSRRGKKENIENKRPREKGWTQRTSKWQWKKKELSFPQLLNHPLSHWRLSIIWGPFSPVRKGDNWPAQRERWATSISESNTEAQPYRSSNALSRRTGEEKAVEWRTERDTCPRGMAMRPTMKWRLRHIEVKRPGGGKQKAIFWKMWSSTHNPLYKNET